MHPFINEIKKRVIEKIHSFVTPSLAIVFNYASNERPITVCNIYIGSNRISFRVNEKLVHFLFEI